MVDVGGGIGSLALKIAKAHPHLRMVIQDRPMVIAMGEGVSYIVLRIITILRCSPATSALEGGAARCNFIWPSPVPRSYTRCAINGLISFQLTQLMISLNHNHAKMRQCSFFVPFAMTGPTHSW
jgi:O-methyltransferase domain